MDFLLISFTLSKILTEGVSSCSNSVSALQLLIMNTVSLIVASTKIIRSNLSYIFLVCSIVIDM